MPLAVDADEVSDQVTGAFVPGNTRREDRARVDAGVVDPFRVKVDRLVYRLAQLLPRGLRLDHPDELLTEFDDVLGPFQTERGLQIWICETLVLSPHLTAGRETRVLQ